MKQAVSLYLARRARTVPQPQLDLLSLGQDALGVGASGGAEQQLHRRFFDLLLVVESATEDFLNPLAGGAGAACSRRGSGLLELQHSRSGPDTSWIWVAPFEQECARSSGWSRGRCR